ncbi:MAG: methyltransferase domain-containing protein [Clostridia bacterium]|nr:methyltransferase domain-containing protein [Clostridia bacterium]
MKWICPVCSAAFSQSGNSVRCANGHCFDFAKEGYLNLLTGNRKKGSETGDNKDMALCRRAFLSKGCFDTLLNAVDAVFTDHCAEESVILDICCGEGYYSDTLKQRHPQAEIIGFDLSKEMIRLAAKRKSGNAYAVANLFHIPLPDNSIDFAFHLFAPFDETEFLRVLKPGGILVSAVAGENHLWQMKEILYDAPYKNDEKPPKTELAFIEKRHAESKIHLDNSEDIFAMFKMTPYFYHTPSEGIRRLEQTPQLDTEISFALYVYRKPAE